MLRTNLRGRKPLLGSAVKSQIKELVLGQPDLTINEIREKLQLKAGYTTVERAVINLGFSIKKKPLHATEQGRPRCKGEASPVGSSPGPEGSGATGIPG